MRKGSGKAEFGIIGSNHFSLKLAMHLSGEGHTVRLIDDTIDAVQTGLQTIASWVEQNRNAELVSKEQEGELLKNIDIGCAIERLTGVQLVFFGTPIDPGGNTRQEEQFRLLEAVLPPEIPILARLNTLGTTGRLLDWVPNPERIVPFATLLEDYVPTTWELWDAGQGRNDKLVVSERVLHQIGFRNVRFERGTTSQLRILFLQTLANCCDILISENGDVDVIDFAFPVSVINLGPFMTADLIGLERVLQLNDEAGEVMSKSSLRLIASYLRTDRTGYQSGEGFYLHG